MRNLPSFTLSNTKVIQFSDRIKIEQCEAQRWCSDLERTVDNLCHWYKWIDDVCNKMMTLQQKSGKHVILLIINFLLLIFYNAIF